MSKKLKKKIEDLCGLVGLDWEARQARANKILASSEWKQSICNDLIGLSFRELEQTLTSVASERQKKEDSYEHKLKTYGSGGKHSNRRPGGGSHDKTNASSGLKHASSKPRSLQEILAQVYAPRVVQEADAELRTLVTTFRTSKSSDEIQPDAANESDCSEE